MKRVKSVFLPFLLVLCLGLLTGCFRATALKEPYAQIMQAFENGGFSVSLSEVSDGTPVAIGENSRWKALNTESGDEVLIYFDDSNRAEYLAGMVEPGPYGQIFWYGQRYILTYAGSSQALLEFLHSL